MEGNTGKQEKIEEFRYYEMPMGRYDLALLGDKWITHYQTNEQHFHNFFEIAYCHYGEGFVYMGEESPSYQKGSITLIPANFPHGIQSAPGRVCFWEFLYVDIMGFAKNCGDEDACAKGKLLQNLINIPLLIEAGEYPRLSGLVLAILEENREYIGFDHIDVNDSIAKVSIVGAGMINNPGVAAGMFEALYSAGINIHMISTSEIKVSVLVDLEDADRAVQVTHNKFFSDIELRG